MPSVLFNNIPPNIRPPLFYAEFQSGGTPYVSNARLLLVGQMLSTGVATAGEPILVRDGVEEDLFGQKSMLGQMYRMARRQAPVQEIWCLPVADSGSGTAASGKIDVAGGPLSQAAPVTLWIANRRVRFVVQTTDSNANIATALAAAINATDDLPLSAAVDGSVNTRVNLTARHKGTLGNAIDISLGPVIEEGNAARTLLTITAMASGAGDPTFSTAFANLADDEFDWICLPYSDSTSLGAVSDLLNDTSGRWSYAKQLYGHAITVNTGTVGAMQTLGLARNDQHASIFPCRKFLSPPWEVCAAVAARAAQQLQTAPNLSRPLQTVALEGIAGPRNVSDRLTLSDRNTLYYSGISGYHMRRDGTVAIDRLTTTYKANTFGDPDWTYLDVETMAQSMYGIRYIRTKVTSQHARKALADSNPGGLAEIVTPQDIKNTIIHAYEDLVALGVFENPGMFARDLVVVRSMTDANRVDASLPLDHVNQLRVLAAAAVNYMQRREPRDSLAA